MVDVRCRFWMSKIFHQLFPLLPHLLCLEKQEMKVLQTQSNSSTAWQPHFLTGAKSLGHVRISKSQIITLFLPWPWEAVWWFSVAEITQFMKRAKDERRQAQSVARTSRTIATTVIGIFKMIKSVLKTPQVLCSRRVNSAFSADDLRVKAQRNSGRLQINIEF